MARRALSVAVAVGLVGLSAPAGAAAASNTAAWRYAVSSASGSVTWRYSGPTGGGSDTVTFRGRARHARVGSVLIGKATYTDQNSQGCGPVTHTKKRTYPGPSFSVQGSYVIVTWRFPLPNQSYCYGAAASIVARQLQAGMLTRAIPLSRFTSCPGLALNLGGQAALSQAGTSGTLTFQATVMLRRTATPINITL